MGNQLLRFFHANGSFQAMMSWFAALIWPYKGCGICAAFIAESNGDFESIRISKAQLVASHTSKSARRFTEWFVETGIFREWIRRKVILIFWLKQ